MSSSVQIPAFRWSLRVKWLLFLLGLLLLFLMASLIWIRRPVEASFRESIENQYSQRVEQRLQAREQRQAQQTESFLGLLQNPRLIAAIQAGDPSQFYHDLSELVEPVFRQLETNEPGPSPFFRYLYPDPEVPFPVPPNLQSKFGIRHPFAEAEVVRALLPFQEDSLSEPNPQTQVGMLEFQGEMEPFLYEAFILPLLDYFGESWGKLAFFVPASVHAGLPDPAGSDRWIHTLVTRQQVYLNQPVDLDWPTLRRQLDLSIEAGIHGSRQIETGSGDWAGILSSLPQASPFTPIWELSLFSTREQESLIESLRGTLTGITAVFGIFTLLLGMGVIRQFTRPLQDLIEGTEAVRTGQLSHRIPLRTRDELGHLAARFNSMMGDLELKDRYRSVLDKVTDARIAEELTRGRIALGGERRIATVLFCDIRAFTPWSASLSPETLVESLNRHMTLMTECVHEHGGVVDKFIGDELMVLFGLPTPDPDAAEKAVQCAQSMIRRRGELNQSEPQPMEIGIGIATGELTAGCMGSDTRLNYTVIGPVVNLASRLCSQAAPQSCLLDNATADAVQDIPLTTAGQLTLKGFDQPVKAWQFNLPTSHHKSDETPS